MSEKKQKFLESTFESILWKSRLVIVIPVVFSLFSSLILFIAGSYKIYQCFWHLIPPDQADPEYNMLLIKIIGAIDLYLIAIVILIFSFGIYELFISRIDIARQDQEVNILDMASLDRLKSRILKVVIMAMVVYFFKVILHAHIETPLEILYLGAGILLISACTFFIRKIDNEA